MNTGEAINGQKEKGKTQTDGWKSMLVALTIKIDKLIILLKNYDLNECVMQQWRYLRV